MKDVPSPLVRGPYHRWLVSLLLEKIARKEGVTQESLGSVVEMHQTTISGILKNDAGTFDLDEAEAMLRHVGSSLRDFVSDPERVPTTRPKTLPPQVRKIVTLLQGVTDTNELRFVVAAATSARARARASGTGMKSSRPRATGRPLKARKTGGTR